PDNRRAVRQSERSRSAPMQYNPATLRCQTARCSTPHDTIVLSCFRDLFAQPYPARHGPRRQPCPSPTSFISVRRLFPSHFASDFRTSQNAFHVSDRTPHVMGVPRYPARTAPRRRCESSREKGRGKTPPVFTIWKGDLMSQHRTDDLP